MRFFQYKAKDVRGYPCSGTLKAENEEAARRELERRRLEVTFLEEDAEATSRVSRKTLETSLPRKKKSLRWHEFLSYAMPIGAAVIALCGIPIVFHFIKPAVPDRSPAAVLETYLHLESSSQFDRQYDLLSPERRRNYASAQVYAQTRRQAFISDGSGTPLVPGKPSGVRELEKSARRVLFEVKVLRPTGVQTGEARLALHRGRWGVDFFRDPEIVNAALDRILTVQDASRQRALTVELKRESGYSDLEIQDLLKERRMIRKNTELGGEAYLL